VKEFIGEILENRNLNNKIFLLKVKVNMRDCIIYPGQFAMLLISDTFDPFLRRPMSFYDVSENLIEFLYQIVGRGTELLSKKEKGEKISFIAPLGNYFPLLKEGEKILLVGGGMGISPLNFLIDFYRNKIDFYSFLGFSSYIQKEVYENFSKYSKEMIISTEDGSLGYKGKILDFIPEDLYSFDKIISCGPLPMLKELYKRVDEKDKLIFSLEERMACGIGICLSCAVEGKDKMLHICKEGPIFSALEVSFNE